VAHNDKNPSEGLYPRIVSENLTISIFYRLSHSSGKRRYSNAALKPHICPRNKKLDPATIDYHACLIAS
jgi:hypothetical protein